MYVDDSKLSEQEAREKASTDQLASTDIRTREFENMVHLYKYVVFHQELGFNSFIGRYRYRVWQFTAGLTAMETHMPYIGSYSVTWHPVEVTFLPLPQLKLVLDLVTPEGCKAELT